MKTSIISFALAITVISHTQGQVATYPLTSAITLINNSLAKANIQLGPGKPVIQTAKITLKAAYDKSIGGGFKFLIKMSGKSELERVCSLTFTFKKIEPTESFRKENFANKEDFEENLTNAIVTAANQWMHASGVIAGLSKSEFKIEISFSAKSSASGGLEFEIGIPDIGNFGINASKDQERTVVHSITLTFK